VLIGLAGLAVVGHSLARQTYLDPADLPALWALGFTRAQLLSLGIARAAIIGTAAACVAVPVAVLLSPLIRMGRPAAGTAVARPRASGRLGTGSRSPVSRPSSA